MIDRKKVLLLALGASAILSLPGCGGGDSTPVVIDGQAPLSAAAMCDSFSGTTVEGATISSSSMIAATATAAEYCRVKGTVHGSLNFEARLPTEWNNRLVFSGGGGWDGVILPVPLSDSSNSGYVVVGTDGGNPTGAFFNAAPFLNNPVAQQDFAYASTHTVLEVVKSLVKKRYTAPLERSYFEGCSNGGREALIAATRFPDDFDGIIARASAYTFTGQMLGGFLANSKAVKAPGGWVSPAKAKLIANSVTAKCDAADGVTDGIVSNPAACTFDPAVLRCTGASSDSCLTDAEINTAKTAYSEVRTSDGQLIYPGWGPGGEDLGWPAWLTGTSATSNASQLVFADGIVKYWVTQNPNFNTLSFEWDAYRPEIALVSSALDATPDLRDFFAKGKKLILAHGTHDWAVSYKASIKYFNDVAGAVGSAATRDANMDLFVLPGVQHCQGGVGASKVDYLTAVRTWVEEGKRPSAQSVSAAKVDTAGNTQLTRPLCRYPTYPRYKGTGDINSASSFECAAP